MNRILTFVLFITTTLAIGQSDFNLELVSNVPIPSGCNDIWGFVDSNGVEYALVGTRTDTRIYDLSTPSQPIEKLIIPGTTTTWRDIKSYGNYIYSISDNTPDGLTVIDMSEAADTITYTNYFPQVNFTTGPDTVVNAHNLYIDENGILYLCGTNVGVGGVIFLDLNIDPEEPPVLGIEDFNYAHDMFARGDTLYTSDIFQGRLSIYDISNKATPLLMGSTTTSMSFTHNAWPSDDGKYIFTTDERSNAWIDAYDISDIANIVKLDRIRTTENLNDKAPHNTHYHNGYLVTSWYSEGVVVVDAHDPSNMVITGQYDTNAGDSGFVGCWGTYPYLPSGLVLATDRQNGLFVLQPDYQRASYLTGLVNDEVTGLPLTDVMVSVADRDEITTFTDAMGRISAGTYGAGDFEITISKLGYITKTFTVQLISGETSDFIETLVPRELRTLNGVVINDTNGDPIEGGIVRLITDIDERILTADANGNFTTDVFEGSINMIAGAWGYLHREIAQDIDQEDIDLTIELSQGYQDDFVLDQNWEEIGSDPDYAWERVEISDLGIADTPGDIGTEYYVLQGIVGGTSQLISPSMDLSGFNKPAIVFEYINIVAESQIVYSFETPQESGQVGTPSNTNMWTSQALEPGDYVTDLTDVRFAITGVNTFGTQNMFGFDAFRVIELEPSSAADITESSNYNIYPNPTQNNVTVESNDSSIKRLELVDVTGKLLIAKEVNGEKVIQLNTTELEIGIYLLKIISDNSDIQTVKIVKE